MLKFSSWLVQGLSRLRSVANVRRVIAASFAAFMLADTSAQTIQLTSSAYSVNENNGTIRVAARRFGDLKTTSTVQISATEGAGAVDGNDFVARTTTLTFPTNSMEVFFDVIILDNDATNASRFINLSLANATNATLAFPRNATIEIVDDETGVTGLSSGTLEFSTALYQVTDYEGTTRAANALSYNGAMITVVRKNGNRGRIQVDFSTGGGNAPTKLYGGVTNFTLTLDDYQMSAQYLIPIFQYIDFDDDLRTEAACWTTNGSGGLTNICGNTNTFPFSILETNYNETCSSFLFFPTNLNFTNIIIGNAFAPTWNLNLILSNPRLDPNEDQTLPKPTLGTRSASRLTITFTDSIKTPGGGPAYLGLGMGMERANYRAAEGGAGSPTGRGISFYQIWVNRDACELTPLTRYEVNDENSGDIGGNHRLRTFETTAGADYATPWVDFIPPGTREWFIAMERADEQTNDGIVEWAINERDPKPLTIPILSDDRVEFDEDLLVRLFQRNGDAGRLQTYSFQPPSQAHVTIVFDNLRFINEDIFHVSYDTNGVFGAEQPAGAGDRRYNRHGVNDIDPPFNTLPGANASVLAVAVGQDGKLVLGGEFESINTKKLPWAYHFGRMTRDGQVDTNFVIGTGPNQAVTAIELQPDGKAIIGGLFSSYNGQLRSGLARVNVDGSLDDTFNPGLGANFPVRAVKLLSDGKVLIGGEFTSFNGTNVNYLARLNENGSLDTSFNANGVGPDGFVYAIAVSGEPIIVELSSLDVNQRRERADTYDAGATEGSITLDYDMGPTADRIRVYHNGALTADTQLVAGQGSVSGSFGPGPVDATLISVVVNEGNPGLPDTTASWTYRLTITPRLDAAPVIGGLFSTYNGVPRNRVARLIPDGKLDTQFDPGTGIESGVVYAVAKHGNKPIVAGVFSSINRVQRNNIAQLKTNGAVDTYFDPGSGFNDVVYSLIVQPTGKAVAGGIFTEFNTSRRLSLARLDHDGKLDTSFMDTAYNQFAGLPNDYTWKPQNSVNALANLRLTATYTATMTFTNQDSTITNIDRVFTRTEDQIFIGGSFKQIGGGLTRDDILPRNNFARVWGGSTPGPGTAGFLFDQYTVDEDSGLVFIVANRDKGELGNVIGGMTTSDLPQGPGAATELQDYFRTQTAIQWPSARFVNNFSRQVTEALRGPTSEERFVADTEPGHGFPGTNDVARTTWPAYVFINEDNAQEGDEQIDMNFVVDPTIVLLGGEPIPMWPALGRSRARLNIIDNDFNPGVIGFSGLQYFYDENIRKARITLTRTNGAAGRVTVDVRTRTPGTTASPGVDFQQISVLTVVFAAGQTNAFFDVDIIDDTSAETDETVSLGLANATGGASLGLGSATLTIIDNDFAAGRVQFTASTASVNEGARTATIVVRRTGGSTGTSRVVLSTQDITAQAGLDYGQTNVVLTWTTGDTSDRIVTIPIYDRTDIESTNLTFRVVLSNPTVNNQPEPNALGNVKQIEVEILNNDAFGNLRFSQPAYVVDENGTNATITVIRVNGLSGNLSVDYAAASENAIPGQDFTPVAGTLTFVPNQTAATFVIPIIDDTVVDGTKTVRLNLSNQINVQAGVTNLGGITFPSTNVVLSIIDNELENIPAGSLDVTFVAEGANDFIYTAALQDDGRLLIGGDFTAVNNVFRDRLARLMPDGTVDSEFFATSSPDNSVRALRVQEDGRILIAGAFQKVGTTVRNYVARLVKDGGIDLTFDPGAGANNPIYSMFVQADGQILIGGDFSAYGPTPRNGLARLNKNGSLDTSFNPGTGASGSGRFTVFAIAQQLDGKLLFGGEFETFNNISANHLVRLNLDGSVDTSFNTAVGANGSVRSIVVQPDGRILVGGIFTSMQGAPANRIARLEKDGTVDSSFNVAPEINADRRGANGPVLAIAVQIDGKIVLGGDFTEYNGVTRRGITRLNYNGRNDATINFGSGANGSVAALVLQPDRRIILAGGFTEYDGQPRLRLARIHGGSISGSGRFEFARANYTVSENSTNVTITVRRVAGTSGTVRMNYTTAADPSVPADATATPGSDYQTVSGTLEFSEGETQASFKVPILNDVLVENEEIFNVVLSDLPGEPFRLGDLPSARVVIVSDDSEIFFSAPSYSVGESIPSAAAAITISRVGSVAVPATVDLKTSNGSATAGADYVAVSNPITFAVGESERTVSIGIIPDALVEGNEFLNLTLSNPSPGALLRPGGAAARLTIVDDDFAPGEIRFERASYSVREANTLARVAVIRTNGLTGVATVRYDTSPVSATPGDDYLEKSEILTFNDGEALKFIEIQISDDDTIENNEVINIRLSNVTGGASLGLNAATLTIVDDDLGSGSLDTGFDPGVAANGPIRAIEYDGQNRYLLGGDFTAYNNDTNRNRIARINVSGAIDTSFSTNNRPNGGIAALALQPDRRIIIGGSFNTVQGQIENRVARLLQDGPLDTSFFLPLGLDAQVSSVVVQPGDNKIIIGGMFRFASAATRAHIARLNSNGTVDISFDPGTGADNDVHTVALQSDLKVLIGGKFGSVNGIGAGRIARLNQDGSVDTSFRSGTGTGFSRNDGRPAVVYDILVLSNGRIVVVGDFTHYNGTPRAGVAMLDQNGLLQSFAAGLQSVNGAIRTVALQHTDRNADDKFIIGGDFTAVDGTPRGRLARLDATGRFDPSFDPGDGANDSVLGIFVQPWDGRVVVVGAFTEFNNNPNFRGIARLNNDKAFLPPAPSEISINTATLTASGGLRLSFNGEQGMTYVIEGTNDFVTWTADRTVTGSGAGTSTEITTSGNYRFFRIRRQ
ncbi:MAG TPA: Calx-beta domain-containing protein [Verrucomicrobiae bacterium]|nr:Calx-beta domain-containing protein [Verrucomicrobiae bacterium]